MHPTFSGYYTHPHTRIIRLDYWMFEHDSAINNECLCLLLPYYILLFSRKNNKRNSLCNYRRRRYDNDECVIISNNYSSFASLYTKLDIRNWNTEMKCTWLGFTAAKVSRFSVDINVCKRRVNSV